MKSAIYSWISLALLIIAESLAWVAIRYDAWCSYGWCAVILCAVIVVIWVIGQVFHAGFKLNKSTLRKMLANAISPTWLGVCYLLAFVGTECWLQELASFGISVIGLLVLIIFFPEGKVDKSGAKKVVFVSGISMINVKKKKDDDKELVISIRNIVPLVSVLDLVLKGDAVRQENVGEFLILDTDGPHKTGEIRLSLMDVFLKNDWDNIYLDKGIDGSRHYSVAMETRPRRRKGRADLSRVAHQVHCKTQVSRQRRLY